MRKLRAHIKGTETPASHAGKHSLQNKPNHSSIGNLAMQDKLRGHTSFSYQVSRKQDIHEREADHMADQVMSMATPAPLATSSMSTYNSGSIQCKARDSSQASTTANISSAMSGKGQPLSSQVRDFFEPRFGIDLSHVRIHDDHDAHQTAKNLNARAFTQNNHIGFDAGQYEPGSSEGKHLLAHELAHVNQQTDANTIYCENWDIDDQSRDVERELLVQLIFENTWTDMISGTGWTTARKTTFRNDFVSSIENTFNNSSYVIKPQASASDVLPAVNIEQGYKPLVDISLVPDGEMSVSEDWEVDVSSNPTSEFRTSSSSTSYGTLDEADNTAVTKMGADPGVKQVPTVHEFGHFIGLDHPGEGLEGGWFSDSQLSPGADEYSHTGTDVEGRTVHGPSDLMGSGMGLRPFYFDAWAEALGEHIEDLRRAAQQQQFQRDWNMFGRALGNDPAGVEWFARGLSGM